MRTIECLYEGHREPCPYNRDSKSCNKTVHHLFWPRKFYYTKKMRRWRNLGKNKVKLCRGLHDVLHETEETPDPPNEKLVDAANEEWEREREERQRRWQDEI